MGPSPSSRQDQEPSPTFGVAVAQRFLGEQSGPGTRGQTQPLIPDSVPSSEPQHQSGSFISRASIFNKQDHDKVW